MRETISRTHRCIHEGVSNSRFEERCNQTLLTCTRNFILFSLILQVIRKKCEYTHKSTLHKTRTCGRDLNHFFYGGKSIHYNLKLVTPNDPSHALDKLAQVSAKPSLVHSIDLGV